MSLLAGELSVLGIAKETTAGTAVVPTNFLRPNTITPVENITYLPDEGLRGSMGKTFDQIQGNKYVTIGFDQGLRVDDIGWPLAALLNDVSVTGSSDPYTDTFALLNTPPGQPTSYTLTDFDGNAARAYAGCMASDLTVTYGVGSGGGGGGGNAGLANFTANYTGMTAASASTPTPSFSSQPVLASWLATVSVGGSSAYIVQDLSIAIKRTITPVFGLSGSQTPSSIFAGGDLEVTGSMTVIYDTANSDALFNDYRNGTKVAVVVDLNSGTHEVKFQMSQVQLDQCTKNRASGTYDSLAINYTAQMNATDVGASAGYSPIKATVKNQLASGVFK